MEETENFGDFIFKVSKARYIAPFYLTVASHNVDEGAVVI